MRERSEHEHMSMKLCSLVRVSPTLGPEGSSIWTPCLGRLIECEKRKYYSQSLSVTKEGGTTSREPMGTTSPHDSRNLHTCSCKASSMITLARPISSSGSFPVPTTPLPEATVQQHIFACSYPEICSNFILQGMYPRQAYAREYGMRGKRRVRKALIGSVSAPWGQSV
jgi:hypothetical protein